MYQATDLLQLMAPSYYLYNGLLVTLVLLDVAWFYYIGRAAGLALFYGQVCKLVAHLATHSGREQVPVIWKVAMHGSHSRSEIGCLSLFTHISPFPLFPGSDLLLFRWFYHCGDFKSTLTLEQDVRTLTFRDNLCLEPNA